MKNFVDYCRLLAVGDDCHLVRGAKLVAKHSCQLANVSHWRNVKETIALISTPGQDLEAAHDLWKSWLILRYWL